MHKIGKKIAAAALGFVFLLSCAGCAGVTTLNAEALRFVQRGDDGLLELIRTSEDLTFYTSDDALTQFMNDFYAVSYTHLTLPTKAFV